MRWVIRLMLIVFCLESGIAGAEPNWRAGRAVYKKCKACHSFKPGVHRFGPSLAGMFERKPGTAKGFDYSKALRSKSAAGLEWTDAALDRFLADPKKVIPGTKMSFPGLQQARDRADVIAYVKRRAGK